MDIYTLFLLLLVIACQVSGSKLTWEVTKQIVRYGEDLSLYCPVDNCCAVSAGWIKWTSEKEFSTIFIDVKDLPVDESLKYGGGTNERGFFLDIRKVKREDLNIKYSCTYGFQVSDKKLLQYSDTFLESKFDHGNSATYNKSGNTTTFDWNILIAVGGSIVVVLIVLLILVTVWAKPAPKGKTTDKKKVEGEVPIVDKSETADKNKVEEEVPLLETSKTADKKKVEGEVPLVETSETADEHPQPVSYKQTNHNKNTNNGKYEVKVQINESRTTVEQQQPASSNQTSHEKTIYSVNNEEEEVPINKSKTTVKQLQPVSSNHTTTANDNTKEL